MQNPGFLDRVNYSSSVKNYFEDFFSFSFMESNMFVDKKKNISTLSKIQDRDHFFSEIIRLISLIVLFPLSLIGLMVREVIRAVHKNKLINVESLLKITEEKGCQTNVIQRVSFGTNTEKVEVKNSATQVTGRETREIDVQTVSQTTDASAQATVNFLGRGDFDCSKLMDFINQTLAQEKHYCDCEADDVDHGQFNFKDHLLMAQQSRLYSSMIIPGLFLGGDSTVLGITVPKQMHEELRVRQQPLLEPQRLTRDQLLQKFKKRLPGLNPENFGVSFFQFSSLGEGVFDSVFSVNHDFEKPIEINENRSSGVAYAKSGEECKERIHFKVSSADFDKDVFQSVLDHAIYLQNNGKSVFVHCTQGRDRSPIFTICLLYRMLLLHDIPKGGALVQKLIAFVNRQRPITNKFKAGQFKTTLENHIEAVESMPLVLREIIIE